MESAESNRNPLIIILLVVCVLNLLGTGYIVIALQSGGTTTATNGKTPLPSDLDSRGERMELLERFMPIYNSKDYAKLYKLLDEAIRIQYTQQELTQSINDIYTIAGEIRRGAYSHYETQPGGPVGTYYALHYQVAADKGNADLTIEVLQQNEEPYRIVGYTVSRQ